MQKSLLFSIILSQAIFIALYSVFSQLTVFLHPVALMVVWFCLTFLVFYIVYFFYKDQIQIPYFPFVAIFLLYNAALLILLFSRPADQTYDSWNLIPFSTITYFFTGEVPFLVALYNLAANVGLFIPWGIFIKLHLLSKSKLFMISFLFIILIETTQFLTHRGSLDIDDLILNMVGVYLGYLFSPMFQRVFVVQKR